MIILYPTTPATSRADGRAARVASIVSLVPALGSGSRVDGDRHRVSSGPIATVFHAAHSTGTAPLAPGNVEDQERAPRTPRAGTNETVRWFVIETRSNTYRVALTDAGTGRESPAIRGMRKAIQLDRPVPAHPEIIIFPTSPIAFINAALPRLRTPEMAQRESEPVLLYDELARIKQRKITRARQMTSPGGVHITNDERQDIADLDAFQKRFSRWMVAHRLSEKIDRMGLDAPSVRRALREIMRDLDITMHDDDHEPHGMRR